ncbi:MAG: SbcC/MukB-like Walker B domain-containing protein, partial [Phototrophicaceae bacterium]
RSFRFVVIDEAFSKLDDENARYAMQLFEKLGLQLLVVTPMQQLQIIEKYVKVFHYVVNNEEGNDSQVINLTDEEYRSRKRELHMN